MSKTRAEREFEKHQKAIEAGRRMANRDVLGLALGVGASKITAARRMLKQAMMHANAWLCPKKHDTLCRRFNSAPSHHLLLMRIQPQCRQSVRTMSLGYITRNLFSHCK